MKNFASDVCEDWPDIKGFMSCHYSRRVPATTRDFRRAFGFAFSSDSKSDGTAVETEMEGDDAVVAAGKRKGEGFDPAAFLQSLGLDRLLAGGVGMRRDEDDNADPLDKVPEADLATLNSVNDFVVKYGLADKE